MAIDLSTIADVPRGPSPEHLPDHDVVESIRATIAAPDGYFNPSGKNWADVDDNLSAEQFLRLPVVRARDIRAAILAAGLQADPTGLSIRGARVTGNLNLDGIATDFPIMFQGCYFEGDIDGSGLHVPVFALYRSIVCGSVFLEYSEITRRLDLRCSDFHGLVDLDFATLRNLMASDIILVSRPGSDAPATEESDETPNPRLSFNQAQIVGNCNLERAALEGGLSATGATIGGNLNLDDATMISCCADLYCAQSHEAISLDGARISVGLFMRNATVRGIVAARYARVSGAIELMRSTIERRGPISLKVAAPSETLLKLFGSVTDGGLEMAGLVVQGGVTLAGAEFRSLCMTGVSVVAPKGRALDLTSCTCTGDAELDFATISGAVVLDRVRISGNLLLGNAYVVGRVSIEASVIGAVCADGLTVRSVLTTWHEHLLAAMRERAARILFAMNWSGHHGQGLATTKQSGFQLDAAPEALTRAKVGTARALSLNQSNVVGDVSLTVREITGSVSLVGATLGGTLRIERVPVAMAPEDRAQSSLALVGDIVVDGISVDGSFEVVNLTVNGRLSAVQASVRSTCDLAGLTIAPSAEIDPVTVDLESASVRRLRLGERESIGGRLNLSRAVITHLEVAPPQADSASIWRRWLRDLRGVSRDWRRVPRAARIPSIAGTRELTIGTVEGVLDGNWRVARDWLDESKHHASSSEFRVQPWLTLADVFERAGHESAGRHLRFHATERLKKQRKGMSAAVWRNLTRVTIGHGYWPALAMAWLLVLYVIAFSIGGTFPDSFTPTDRSAAITEVVVDPTDTVEISAATEDIHTGSTTPILDAYPPFYAGLYAVDIVVPSLESGLTGQSAAWRVSNDFWLVAAFTALKALSWVLLGLFLTGIAGLYKAR
ncbi:hypothetical protein [Cryobacterium sp. Hz9]|uniref:hypothetical protein n=1 Tax=Cryobacterium sp. Hz9 TaxID=1259167 RepID=UPI00106B2E09|nr:hypothetical protein [Cryobacterium sp. Hz9]TFB66163.1 hypothetical protein E3N85_09980 [Cryobacterium sp. Hz9]